MKNNKNTMLSPPKKMNAATGSVSQVVVLPAGKDVVLVRSIAIVFICTGLIISAMNLLAHVGMRPGGPGLLLTGAGMLVLVHFGYYTQAAVLSGWCLVVIAFMGAYAALGIMNVSWIALPVGVMLTGWFAGKRAAFILAAGGVLEILTMYWLHRQGVDFDKNVPLEVVTVSLIVATVVAALLGGATATAFRQQLTQINQSREHLNLILDSTHDMIWSVDPVNFELTSSNHAFKKYFLSAEKMQGKDRVKIEDLLSSPDSVKAWKNMYACALRERQYATECTGIKHGDVLSLRFTVMERGSEIVGISVFGNDVTEEKKTAEKIKFLAFNDVLTGLPNRLAGQQNLKHALAFADRHKERAAVLFLDIDRFKHVNDLYGHTTGDLLLQGVAQRLRECVRGQDTLCRLSSDEFMVVLTEVEDENQVSNTCQRILSVLGKTFELNGLELSASFSIGAGLYPQHGMDGETLMSKAAMALSEAKKSGAHSFRLFEQHMNDKLLVYLETKNALRQAITDHQFVLHYQPQINLATGQVSGMEALIRWQSPERGLVMPDTFISVAEESGMIREIGLWVLGTACRQTALWHAAGWSELVMSVNLSSAQFLSPGIAQDVLKELSQSGLRPSCLELELTESIMLGEDERVGQILSQWHEHGVRLSIDDFGTGYSSMAYLKRMQIDKLKIDRSFITTLDTDLENRSIVQGIIHIAKGLNIAITAEGVENKVVENYLRDLDCDEVQGYLYAMPLPLAEVEKWLEAHKSAST